MGPWQNYCMGCHGGWHICCIISATQMGSCRNYCWIIIYNLITRRQSENEIESQAKSNLRQPCSKLQPSLQGTTYLHHWHVKWWACDARKEWRLNRRVTCGVTFRNQQETNGELHFIPTLPAAFTVPATTPDSSLFCYTRIFLLLWSSTYCNYIILFQNFKN